MFEEAYSAIDSTTRQGDWFADVDVCHLLDGAGCGGAGVASTASARRCSTPSTRRRRDAVSARRHGGKPRRQHFENLQAFWPGLQVLSGDLELASRSSTPSGRSGATGAPCPKSMIMLERLVATRTGLRYPLRPELIEATYFMHRATQDDSWLWAASRVFEALEQVAEGARCGAASFANAATHALEDEMPSFYLAETVKYLYLLFDEDNFISKRPLFSTEAHPFDAEQIKRLTRAPRLVETMAPPPVKNESTLAALWRRLRATTTTRPALRKKHWRRREQPREPTVPVSSRVNIGPGGTTWVILLLLSRRSPRPYPRHYLIENVRWHRDAMRTKHRTRTTRRRRRSKRTRRRHHRGRERLADEATRSRGEETRAQVDGLGSFDVEVFSDGFHVGNREDGETSRGVQCWSSMMLVTSSSRGTGERRVARRVVY